MSFLAELSKSAVAKKAIMAVTGLILFGWILGHMIGNLKIFQGPEKFNAYAEFLKEMGAPMLPESGALWIVRILLLVSVGLHIWAATTLTFMNRRARAVGYGSHHVVQADYAARTMRVSGYLIAVYILYHLMHFTFGNAHPAFDPASPYHNVVSGFQVAPVALVYILANLLLGMHLYHGLWSLFQSLGWNYAPYNAARRKFAIVFSIAITAGFVSIPVAVLLGIVR